MSKRPYTKTGRLADVLALIQVLALDPYTRRSMEDITTRELQGPPTSASNWIELAKEHREFFRVNQETEHGLSLVARYVLPHSEGEKRPQLPTDFTSQLLQTAITLHDRQVAASEWWKIFIQPVSMILSAIIGAATALATLWFKEFCSK